MNAIETIIEQLQLQPHPEGGYFRETYRCDGKILQAELGNSYSGDRNYATSIYFLLTYGNFSAFHKIVQDEQWHFYEGSPILLHMISPMGVYTKIWIGRDLSRGEVPQFTVPGGYWFASEVTLPGSFALAGCTVAPGFDFADFTLPSREELTSEYPKYKEVIHRLTRA